MLRRLWKRLNADKYASFAQLTQQDAAASEKEIIITQSTVNTATLEGVSILVDEKAVFINQGIIKGTIVSRGGKIILYGKFEGYLQTLGLLHIKKESIVSGEIACSKLIITPGGELDGNLTMYSVYSDPLTMIIDSLSNREKDWLKSIS